jgi:hypothetical protein
VVGFYGRDEHGLVVCLTAGDTFLFGVDEGSFSPASSVTVAEVFPKPERARAKSFLISTVFLGNAAGSGLIGLTVARLGWRGSFHILAVVGMGVALILLFTLRGGMASQRERAADRPRVSWNALLRTPMAWKLTAIWFFTSMLYVGVQSWMPSYLMKTYRINLLQIGLAATVPNLIAFAGTNAVGVLLDKHGNGRAAMQCQCVALDCYPHTSSSTMLHTDEAKLQGRVVIATCEPYPEYSGRELGQIADEWQVNRVEAARRLQPASAVYFSMDEGDVRNIMAFEETMIGSDGLAGGSRPHPRLWGRFRECWATMAATSACFR